MKPFLIKRLECNNNRLIFDYNRWLEHHWGKLSQTYDESYTQIMFMPLNMWVNGLKLTMSLTQR